ncbi:hypothetical protein NQ318_014383 [Aromia moschata]|uniref:Uncharacterized protein n=1 Tax=Aromia moschata TaxID=1265417 RepID=A0AAV8XMM2_9CUCU|nr:hypothetical protein NQ318_014383 [Aromia moschata]
MADAMAASSGGVDWATILKPFLSANYETSNKAELLRTVLGDLNWDDNESEILRHKETNRNFYNSFAVLASDYISSSTTGCNEKDISNKQESSKSRSDLSVSIYEQLTLPLRDGHTSTHDQGAVAPLAPRKPPPAMIPLLKLTLQALRAGDTLIDLCLSLPSIKRAKTKVEEALAGEAVQYTDE